MFPIVVDDSTVPKERIVSEPTLPAIAKSRLKSEQRSRGEKKKREERRREREKEQLTPTKA